MPRKSMITAIICWVVLIFIGISSAYGLDLRDEMKLGKEVLKKIQETYKFLNIPEVNYYITEVGKKLTKEIPPAPYPYKFIVVDQDIPNAFTIPGGYVFVNSGLITLMDKEGELASVLAHELAHGHGRHIHKQLEEQKTLMVASLAAILAGALIGNPQLGQAITTGTLAGAQTAALSYSRDNEREADQMGAKILKASGYPLTDAVNAMQKLAQKQWQGKPGTYDYLMSHPGILERIDYLSTVASSEKGRKKVDPGLFPYAKADVLALYSNTKELSRMVNNGDSLGYGGSVVEYVKGLMAASTGRMAEAIACLEKSWRLSEGGVFSAVRYADFLSRQKQYDKAKVVLEGALAKFHDNLAVNYRYGTLLEDEGNYEAALKHYTMLEEYADIFLDLDYKIGTVLGKLGRLGEAHTHLGDHYAKLNDQRLAQFHYEKALSLLTNPQQKETVNRKLKDMKHGGKEEDEGKKGKF